jgi:hypothetical protein
MLELGTRLKRRAPAGDEWDTVVVRGRHYGGELEEIVVSPVSFGTPVSTTPESLVAAYTLDVDTDDPSEALTASLAKLKAEPWTTPSEEIASV